MPTGPGTSMRAMDDELKTLAAVGEALDAADAELAEGGAVAATEHLDAAERGLADLRARWPALGTRDRTILGAAAAPVRRRLDELRARVPRRTALADAAAVVDPEQEEEPAGAEAA